MLTAVLTIPISCVPICIYIYIYIYTPVCIPVSLMKTTPLTIKFLFLYQNNCPKRTLVMFIYVICCNIPPDIKPELIRILGRTQIGRSRILNVILL